MVRIAVCQILAIDGDREGNFRRIEYALQTARSGRADIAAFPESVILGWQNPEAHLLAAQIPGADADRIAALARRYGLMISIGLDEKDGGLLYDSAILVDSAGTLKWKHRKLELLAQLMDPPYTAGIVDGIGVVDTQFGRIGVLICADTFVDAYAKRIAALRPYWCSCRTGGRQSQGSGRSTLGNWKTWRSAAPGCGSVPWWARTLWA